VGRVLIVGAGPGMALAAAMARIGVAAAMCVSSSDRVKAVTADEFECVQLGSNDAKKVLQRPSRDWYGSKRSRAARAARWR